MDNRLIREKSSQCASRLGYPTNPSLPLLDGVNAKSTEQILTRLLYVYVAAACAYGFDRRDALVWLRRENLFVNLAPSERQFIESRNGGPAEFRARTEGLWALAWALGYARELDFGKVCDDDSYMIFPNLKTLEDSSNFRAKARVRPLDEIAQACDIAYCLHWAIIDALLSRRSVPGRVSHM